jgi:hypothetical protein
MACDVIRYQTMTHVKNMQAFEKLAGYCTGWRGFNPGRQSLKVGALTDQFKGAQRAIDEVIMAKTRYDNEVNLRKQVFDELPRLTSRIMRTLEATGAKPEKLDDALGFMNQILGRSPRNRPPASPAGRPVPSEQPAALEVRPERSKLQLAYVSKAHAFSSLVEAVLSEPTYEANEAELSREGLAAKADELHRLNAQVTEARIAWSNSLVHRNKVLYTDPDAVVITARRVKKYVRALYGFGSEEYAQVKGIVFTKPAK